MHLQNFPPGKVHDQGQVLRYGDAKIIQACAADLFMIHLHSCLCLVKWYYCQASKLFEAHSINANQIKISLDLVLPRAFIGFRYGFI